MALSGKRVKAHRISYLINVGDIPAGMLVRHVCDNPACVNPQHLLVGTDKDNSQDRERRKRSKKGAARGVANKRAKLTESDIRYIRTSKKTNVALGAELGVKPHTISRVRLGRRWAHIK